jgi:hypothetical protein
MDQPRQTLTVTEKYSDFGGEGKCIGYNVPIFRNLQKGIFRAGSVALSKQLL